MIEVLRFLLFLATTIVLVKVGEDVLLNWKKDSSVDVPLDEDMPEFDDRQADDLTQIEGINQDMLPILTEAGFASFSDIELADIADLKRTMETSYPQVSISELKLWMKQANYLVQGQIEDFERLKATMSRARMKRRIQ